MASTIIVRDFLGYMVHKCHLTSKKEFLLPLLQEYHGLQELAELINANCPYGILVVLDGTESSTDDMIDHNDTPGKITPWSKYTRAGDSPKSAYHPTMEEAKSAATESNLFIWDGKTWEHELVDKRKSSSPNPFKRKGNRWGRN